MKDNKVTSYFIAMNLQPPFHQNTLLPLEVSLMVTLFQTKRKPQKHKCLRGFPYFAIVKCLSLRELK